MKKIGVYICQCGTNIAGKVDVAKIAEEIGARTRATSRFAATTNICVPNPGRR